MKRKAKHAKKKVPRQHLPKLHFTLHPKSKKAPVKKEKHPVLKKSKPKFSLFSRKPKHKEEKKEKPAKKEQPAESKKKLSFFSHERYVNAEKPEAKVEKPKVEVPKEKVEKPKPKKSFSLFKKKKSTSPDLKKEIRRLHKKKKKAQKRRNLAQYWLEKAGIDREPKAVAEIMLMVASGGAMLLGVLVLYFLMFEFETPFLDLVIFLVASVIIGFGLLMIAAWLVFYVYIDLRIYKRRVGIEEVLPDFLLLTASNIRAGMTTDRALWFAVRPRFGVLAKEMEVVAKQTASGQDLSAALRAFAEKYDSKILSRAISLLIESSEAGGEIGDVLEKIAKNVQQVKIMRKEMAANVMTYVIFITFAAIGAAPILFSLAGQMLVVIQRVVSELDISDAASSGSGFMISVSEVSITQLDFMIFAISSLSITAVFSSIIVATILKGNVREGLKYLPVYLLVSLSLFIVSSSLFGMLFDSLL